MQEIFSYQFTVISQQSPVNSQQSTRGETEKRAKEEIGKTGTTEGGKGEKGKEGKGEKEKRGKRERGKKGKGGKVGRINSFNLNFRCSIFLPLCWSLFSFFPKSGDDACET